MANQVRHAAPRTVFPPFCALVVCAILWPALVTFDPGDWPSPHQYPHNIPPLNAWGEYVVSLTGGGVGWTRLLGTGTFANALTVVDRVHVRHDLRPSFRSRTSDPVGTPTTSCHERPVGVNPFDPRVTHWSARSALSESIAGW
jgi:hypothetical protein